MVVVLQFLDMYTHTVFKRIIVYEAEKFHRKKIPFADYTAMCVTNLQTFSNTAFAHSHLSAKSFSIFFLVFMLLLELLPLELRIWAKLFFFTIIPYKMVALIKKDFFPLLLPRGKERREKGTKISNVIMPFYSENCFQSSSSSCRPTRRNRREEI